MKHIAQSLGLGLAILAATSASPRAADWAVGSGGVIKDFGSVKDYRNAAVPVPAPTPAPTYSKDWYVRGDIAWTLASTVDTTATGGISTRDDLAGFAFGSIGAGRYLTPSIRAEMSFDFRPKKSVTEGTQYFQRKINQTGAVNVAGNPTVDTFYLDVRQYDGSTVSDQTAFTNLYYDFNRGGRLTPYVGAGIGLDYRRFKRITAQASDCVATDNTDTVTGVVTHTVGSCGTGPSLFDDKFSTAIGVAAAVMVGVGYEVSPGITWDTGYRGVWEGATVSLGARSVDGFTSISLGNRFDHELRTGVRVDLQ